MLSHGICRVLLSFTTLALAILQNHFHINQLVCLNWEINTHLRITYMGVSSETTAVLSLLSRPQFKDFSSWFWSRPPIGLLPHITQQPLLLAPASLPKQHFAFLTNWQIPSLHPYSLSSVFGENSELVHVVIIKFVWKHSSS